MKRWIFAAITMGCVMVGGSAMACPTSGDFAPPPRPRPVQRPLPQVSNPPIVQASFQQQASTLFVRASELDSAAGTRERNALAFESEADTLSSRARTLRNQAQLVSLTTDRENILEIVDELVERAELSRSRASVERTRASELRSEARVLRDRANQLVRLGNGNGNGNGNGGGWRGRLGASEGVTL